MARAKLPPIEVTQDTGDLAAFEHAHNALNILAQDNIDANENAKAVALQIGYDGELTVGCVEDRLKQSMRRSVESVLETGKALLVLKELTPHGGFDKRLELLNFNVRTARRFMSMSLKFANRTSMSVLDSSSSPTKLLELLALDDDEISELENGETVRGVSLDKLDKMTVRELKAALKTERADSAAKDKVLADKSAALDKALVQKAVNPYLNWTQAFSALFTIADDSNRHIEHHLRLLENVRLKAMQVEAAEGEEDSLLQARKLLAQTLSRNIQASREAIEAIDYRFANTLQDLVLMND